MAEPPSTRVTTVDDDADALRIVRRILPWILLVLVLMRVAAILAEFRTNQQTAARSAATVSSPAKGSGKAASPPKKPTASATAPAGAANASPTASSGGQTTVTATVVVVSDGVNFRAGPDSGSAVIATESKDTTLTWLGDAGSWYHVRDAQGREGYVTSSTRFVQRR